MIKTKAIALLLLVFIAFSCNEKKERNEPDPAPPAEKPTTPTNVDNDTVAVSPGVKPQDESNELADFYSKNEKKAQSLLISNDKDTTIVCAEKTKITIKANSFASVKTGAGISGKVKLSVKEYYKMSDILLARLSTTTNGKLLETGGMLNITASSGNENLRLKKGKTIDIEFPRKEEKEGMQLYTGNWKGSQLNWNLVQNSVDLNQVFSTATLEKSPEFPGGMRLFYKYISNNIQLPDGLTGGKIISRFIIDRNGKVTNTQIIRGLRRDIDAEVLRCLRKSPNFIPGKLNGMPVNVSYTLPITISSTETEDSPKEIQANFEETYTDKNLNKAEATEISNYLFSSSELGWINCDRLWRNSTAPKVDYIVNFDKISETSVNLVFHRFKSMMGYTNQSGSALFYNIPSGEDVTIVAIKFFDGKPYLAIKDSKTSAKREMDLAFKPVSMEMLKSEMKKLDRFN